MTLVRLVLFMLLLGVATPKNQAQTATPASPKKFETRKNGSTTEKGSTAGTGSSVGLVSAGKKQEPKIITYTVLTKVREWENISGKKMRARLLAFPSPGETSKNTQLIVIRDQKVRFLMSYNNTPAIYPLEKLSDFDREYIEEIALGVAQATKTSSSQKKKKTDEEAGIQTEKSSNKKK